MPPETLPAGTDVIEPPPAEPTDYEPERDEKETE
jgi:hypothetical protein